MATESINYRVDVKRPDGNWDPWYWATDLGVAKEQELGALDMSREIVRDARIVEVRRTYTETILGVAAASLDILSREEI